MNWRRRSRVFEPPEAVDAVEEDEQQATQDAAEHAPEEARREDAPVIPAPEVVDAAEAPDTAPAAAGPDGGTSDADDGTSRRPRERAASSSGAAPLDQDPDREEATVRRTPPPGEAPGDRTRPRRSSSGEDSDSGGRSSSGEDSDSGEDAESGDESGRRPEPDAAAQPEFVSSDGIPETEETEGKAAEQPADGSTAGNGAGAADPPAAGMEAAVAALEELAPATRTATVLCVANQKGGVGKTTTAVSVAAALAQDGAEVLVVDLDPQGNATTGLGLRAEEGTPSTYQVLIDELPVEDAAEPTAVRGLHVLPSGLDLAGAEIELVSVFSREARLRDALAPVRDLYDVILIDCPPSLGLLTVNALVAADQVIVPIQCEYYALEGLGQLMRTIRLVSNGLNDELALGGVVLTMYDARTNLSQQVVDEVRDYFGEVAFQTVVPRTVRLSEAPSYGQPITVFDASSRGARAYQRLARELAGRLGLTEDDDGAGDPLDRLLGSTAASEAAAEDGDADEGAAGEVPEGGAAGAPADGTAPDAGGHETVRGADTRSGQRHDHGDDHRDDHRDGPRDAPPGQPPHRPPTDWPDDDEEPT